MAAFLRYAARGMKTRFVWPAIAAAAATALVAALRRAKRMAANVREISDRATAQTAAASLMRDHLMAAASHDLKAPLASIKLLVHLLRRDAARGPVPTAQLVKRIDLIETNVNRMSSLINELLDVARLQGGKPVQLHPVELDLVALARRVVASFETASDQHTVVLDAEVGELIGEWDESRLERVIANLIGNAIKYSPEGGQITVILRRGRERGRAAAVLSVHDSGIGIPPRDLPRVMEWFHRGANVGQIGGTGVGLASAKLIVEKHGGSIDVRSGPRRGTTITLRLPLSEAHRERVPVETSKPRVEERSSASPG